MNESSWFAIPNNEDAEYLPYKNFDGDNEFVAITNNLYNAFVATDKVGINKSIKFWGTAVKQILDDISSISSSDIIEVGEEIKKPSIVTEKEAECIAYDATEHAITIIQGRYDIDEIIEDLTWISQLVMDDIADYIADTLDTNYIFSSSEENAREDAIEQICSMINWDHIYGVLEEYVHQPRTMFDKLRDIGMRESDFL